MRGESKTTYHPFRQPFPPDYLIKCGLFLQSCWKFFNRNHSKTCHLRPFLNSSSRRCLLLLLAITILLLVYGFPFWIPVREEEDHWAHLVHRGFLQQLKNTHLFPPYPKGIPYNLSVTFKSYGEHDKFNRIVLGTIFKNQKRLQDKGFFVEAGALDGQYLSHTLELESKFGWKGLLIEASPSKVKELKSKKRKAWVADVCLTNETYTKAPFMTKKNQKKHYKRGNGKIALKHSFQKGENRSNYVVEEEVECYHLFSLLKAIAMDNIGPKVVDLLVLDIEGGEYQILEGYPFHLLPIKVVAVEHWLTPEGPNKIIELMTRKGYVVEYQSVSDLVFILKSAKLDFEKH
ncbi:unnamed protein product [Orchesella dallaii]|uniref:Methyltransferase FkbM domain-containing protein n=1 Tax=Orchesella dallaii TaxID=48710 RepID=A0ABP1RYU8_9HEXA